MDFHKSLQLDIQLILKSRSFSVQEAVVAITVALWRRRWHHIKAQMQCPSGSCLWHPHPVRWLQHPWCYKIKLLEGWMLSHHVIIGQRFLKPRSYNSKLLHLTTNGQMTRSEAWYCPTSDRRQQHSSWKRWLKERDRTKTSWNPRCSFSKTSVRACWRKTPKGLTKSSRTKRARGSTQTTSTVS